VADVREAPAFQREKPERDEKEFGWSDLA